MRSLSLPRRGVLLAVALLLVPFALGSNTSPVTPSSVVGTWSGTAKAKGVTGKTTWILQQQAGNVTGTLKLTHKAFSSNCNATILGSIAGTLANQVLSVELTTPHINPITCQSSPADVNAVGLSLHNNVHMTGSFSTFVQELDEIVVVSLDLKRVSGKIGENDPDGAGPGVPFPNNGQFGPGANDLAVTQIKVPRTVVFKGGASEVSKLGRVRIQNRGQHPEIIPDHDTLAALVSLVAGPLGAGPAPVITLREGKPQKSFPITLKPKQTLNVVFDVVFTGASDPLKTTKKVPHDDLSWTANVNRLMLPDGLPDHHAFDDDCPRQVAPPFEFDFYPDGKLKERGCGTKFKDGSFGGPVLTDVVIP